MRGRIVGMAVLSLFIAAGLQAQRGGRGAGGSGGNGPGPMSSQQQQGSMQQQQQGSWQQQTMRSQQQMRVQSMATDQQRTAIKQTMTATRQLRTELRPMTRLQNGQQIGKEQARLWRERIRAQLQALQQQQQAFVSSLTPDQESWAAADILQMTQSSSDLVDMLENLDLALQAEELDQKDIKEAARKADDKAKSVESEEKQILSELGLA